MRAGHLRSFHKILCQRHLQWPRHKQRGVRCHEWAEGEDFRGRKLTSSSGTLRALGVAVPQILVGARIAPGARCSASGTCINGYVLHRRAYGTSLWIGGCARARRTGGCEENSRGHKLTSSSAHRTGNEGRADGGYKKRQLKWRGHKTAVSRFGRGFGGQKKAAISRLFFN